LLENFDVIKFDNFSLQDSEEEDDQNDLENEESHLQHNKKVVPKKNGKVISKKHNNEEPESELHFPEGNANPVVITPLLSTKQKKQLASKKAVLSVDDPNNMRYPEKSFSFTITNSKGDVDRELLAVLKNFMMESPCFIWGAFSLEVGQKAHKLHFQGTGIMRWPTGKEFISILAKHIKSLFPDNGKGYR